MRKAVRKHIELLDAAIAANNNPFHFYIFGKPTSTDVKIPNSPCHPHLPKESAEVQLLMNKLQKYLTDENEK
jgi:hypothetical protein